MLSVRHLCLFPLILYLINYIMALVNKNCMDVPRHSSSYMLGYSVRVHLNPLFDECIVNNSIRSDLEFAQQNKDEGFLSYLSRSYRNPRYSSQLPRHVSTADCLKTIDDCNRELDDLSSPTVSDAPASDVSASAAPASEVPVSAN